MINIRQLTIKQRVVIVAAIGLIILSIILASAILKNGYVNILADPNNTYSLTILGKDGEQVFFKDSITGNYSKRINSGGYSVIISGPSSNIFNVEVPGGLKGIDINNGFDMQKDREIVGYNPLGCITKADGYYYSLLCDDISYNYVAHEPSLGKQPPYASQKTIEDYGVLGTIVDNNQTIALKAEAFDEYRKYRLDIIGKDLQSTQSRSLEFLNDAAFYNIANFKDGFVIYTANPLDVYYFEDYGSKGELLPLPKLDINLFVDNLDHPNKVSISDYGMVVWQTVSEEEYLDLESSQSEEYTVNYSIFNNAYEMVKSGSFKSTPIQNFIVCEEYNYCVHTDNRLDFYSLGSNDKNKLYTINNIQYTNQVGDLYFTRDSDLFKYEVSEKAWKSIINIGDNKFCGFNVMGNSIYSCLINPQNGRVALSISDRSLVFDIENKVNELYRTVSDIRTVTVYKKDVFVTTDNGELAFDPSRGGYYYSAGTVASNKNKVNAAFNDLGFNKNGYKLIMQDF